MTRRAVFAHYSHVARRVFDISACCISNWVGVEYCMRNLQCLAAAVTLILNINCLFGT